MIDIRSKRFQDVKTISFFAVLSLSIFITINNPQNSFATHTTGHILGFAAAGDWGCNSNTDATATAIYNKGSQVDLVFGLGDYSYQSSATCFINEMKESGNNIFPKMDGTTLTGGTGTMALGNHEYDSSGLQNTYASNFNFPSSGYYSFNVGTSPNLVHFLFINTETSFSTSSSQYNFVRNDLQTASGNPDVKWIVVSFHKPLYSSPNECSSSTCAGYPSFRSIYHPLFDQYKVDLVLDGHTHDYQRSYPIKYGGSSSASPVKTSSNTNTYNDPEGIIQALVGTGGVNFHDLTSKSSFVAYQQDSRFGFLQVDITQDGTAQTLTGRFYGNGLSTPMDTFTITKGPQQPKYHFEPFFNLDGNDKYDISDSASLRLSTFSVAAWFKTTSNFAGDAFIVNKGGQGSTIAGQNQNYGIWMNSEEKIRFGFETTGNIAQFLKSPNVYNDGNWHLAVGTFDNSGNNLRLYIDGVEVASKTTSDNPDNTGTQPLRIGANSQALNAFFTGQIDEVRVWNKALTSSEVSNLYNNAVVPTGVVAYTDGSAAFNSVDSTGQGKLTPYHPHTQNNPELKTQNKYAPYHPHTQNNPELNSPSTLRIS